jgi:mutator protein MutT
MLSYKYCPYCKSDLKTVCLDNRSRLQCPSCKWINYLNPIPAVVALLRNDRGDVLLVKRAVDPALGKWALPAGYIEIDETVEQALKRELHEETGLKAHKLRLLGVYIQKSVYYESVLTIGYIVDSYSGELRAGDDADDVAFRNISDITDLPFESHRKILAADGF